MRLEQTSSFEDAARYQPLVISCRPSQLTLTGMSFGPVVIAASSSDTAAAVTVPVAAETARGLSAIRARLSRLGRAAAQSERQHLDRDLTARFRRGDISAVYYYRCLGRMTQEDLALRSGTRQSYLSQIEKGHRPLTWKQATKIAPHLGVATSDLMEKR